MQLPVTFFVKQDTFDTTCHQKLCRHIENIPDNFDTHVSADICESNHFIIYSPHKIKMT